MHADSECSTAVLKKVKTYAEHTHEHGDLEFDMPLVKTLPECVGEWYANFITEDVDKEMLFKLSLAANWLGNKSLMKLCCAKIAVEIENKTVEEKRAYLGYENDYTPEEEAKIKEENKAALDAM